MRSLVILLFAACSLDPSSKPECLVDDDCRYRKAHCVEQVCVPNYLPTAMPDVVYVLESPVTVVADVTRNDIDPDGDPIEIEELSRGATDFGYIGPVSVDGRDHVEIDVTEVPATYSYKAADAFGKNPEPATITVAWLSEEVTVPVESGTSASLVNVFGAAVQHATVELLTPPAHGMLMGTAPDTTYVPLPDYCGLDTAVYRVHAANKSFDVTVTFHVGILLQNEQASIAFGEPSTIDVLANERSGIELTAVDHPTATITGATLRVDPPTGDVSTYAIRYTARDARNCDGIGTLTVHVEFPTRVVVGDGLTGDAFDAAVSTDGRYVAFTSADSSLVSGDTNGTADVFVRDLSTGATTRVSVASDGTQANEASGSPTISGDGRWVAFVSRATNIAAADTTSVEDIYLHDRTTATTTLVSVSIDNTGSDQPSLTPHISTDGARVVFASSATRVVSNDTNDVLDIFVRDIGTSTTSRVSLTGSGAQVPYASHVRPRISGNGRYVVLSSSSSLDGTGQGGSFLIDTTGGAVVRIDTTGELDIDDVGRFVAHAHSYANGQTTLHDRVVENETNLGYGGFPALSADGRYITYSLGDRVLARGTGMPVDVLVDAAGDVVEATPLRRPEISGDGRWIVFATSEWPGYQGRFVIVRVWNRAQP